MSGKFQTERKSTSHMGFALASVLQRKCASSIRPEPTGDREGDRVHDELLASALPRLGHNFSQISLAVPALPNIEPNLRVNSPGDADEQEADRVADHVILPPNRGKCRTDEPAILRRTWQPARTIHQRREGNSKGSRHFPSTPPESFDVSNPNASPPITPAFRSRLAGSKGTGRALDDFTRDRMESAMGGDLSDVKIHTTDDAHALSESINAKAFTHGQDIYFQNGHYDPGSTTGIRLLAHELAHTRQRPLRKLRRSIDDDLEKLRAFHKNKKLKDAKIKVEQGKLDDKGKLLNASLTRGEAKTLKKFGDKRALAEYKINKLAPKNKKLEDALGKVDTAKSDSFYGKTTAFFTKMGRWFSRPRRRRKLRSGKKRMTKLKADFNEAAEGIINIHNRHITDDAEKISPEAIATHKNEGLSYLDLKAPYSDSAPVALPADNTGVDTARSLMKQYLVNSDPAESPTDIPLGEDIALIMKYMLSQSELTEEDKELVIAFVRKYVSDRRIQNQVFGYGDDKIEPAAFTAKLQTLDLMSKAARAKLKKDKKSERALYRREKRAMKAAHRAHVDAVRTSQMTRPEKRREKHTLRKNKREARRELRFQHKPMARYIQLEDTKSDLISSLDEMKPRHEYNIQKDELKSGEEHISEEVFVGRSPIEQAAYDFYKELDGEVELTDLLQMNPYDYRKAYAWQQRIDAATTPQDKEQFLFLCYRDLYGDKVDDSNARFGRYYESGELAVFAKEGKVTRSNIFAKTYPTRYLGEGGKLNDPNEVYNKLLSHFKEALISIAKETAHWDEVTQFFNDRYLDPAWKKVATPTIITVATAALYAASKMVEKGNYTGLGILSDVKIDEKKTLFDYSHKVGGTTNARKLDVMLNNKLEKEHFGGAAAPGASLFGKNPSLNLNVGTNFTRSETEKEELKRKVVLEAMLKYDVLLGNKKGEKDILAQTDYLLRNFDKLDTNELKNLKGFNMAKFLDTTTMNQQLQKSPEESVHNFRLELSGAFTEHKTTFLLSSGFAAYNTFSSTPILAVKASAGVSGTAEHFLGGQLKYASSIDSMLNNASPQEKSVGLKVSFTYTNHGFFITSSASQDVLKWGQQGATVSSKVGLNIPPGKQQRFGTYTAWLSVENKPFDKALKTKTAFIPELGVTIKF